MADEKEAKESVDVAKVPRSIHLSPEWQKNNRARAAKWRDAQARRAEAVKEQLEPLIAEPKTSEKEEPK